eukprot:GHVS01086221.1.p1 GENE.GHVS01086221.1~~GHVS01086221.1.p1  ORF type:complete len:482 (+),score=52.06 GHVS01086221.1:138-1583(+)
MKIMTASGHYRRVPPSFEGSTGDLLGKLSHDICCGEACRRTGGVSPVSGTPPNRSSTSQIRQRVADEAVYTSIRVLSLEEPAVVASVEDIAPRWEGTTVPKDVAVEGAKPTAPEAQEEEAVKEEAVQQEAVKEEAEDKQRIDASKDAGMATGPAGGLPAAATTVKSKPAECVERRPEILEVAMMGDMDGGIGTYVNMRGKGGPKRVMLSICEGMDLGDGLEPGRVLRFERGAVMKEIGLDMIDQITEEKSEVQAFIDSGKLDPFQLVSDSLSNAFVLKLNGHDELIGIEAGSEAQKNLILSSIRQAKASKHFIAEADIADDGAPLSEMLQSYGGSYKEFKCVNRWIGIGVFLAMYPGKKVCELFLDTDLSRILFRRNQLLRSLPVRLINRIYSTQEELDSLAARKMIETGGDSALRLAIAATGFRKPFVIQMDNPEVKNDLEAALMKLSGRMDEEAGGEDIRTSHVKHNKKASSALTKVFD